MTDRRPIVSDRGERRMVERTDPRDWHRIAEAMAWAPEDEVPSWMTPDERAWFWREVAEGARRAVVDREMARIRAEMESELSAPVLWLAGAVGRVMGWLRALAAKLREAGR